MLQRRAAENVEVAEDNFLEDHESYDLRVTCSADSPLTTPEFSLLRDLCVLRASAVRFTVCEVYVGLIA
jgi:hypothetical protein